MKLSIIVVNYNGKQFFKNCFASIGHFVPFEHEVIVVDNASTDGSTDYLTHNFPAVTVISLKENIGFAGGNNTGIQYATGDYILLLNNDTALLSPLTDALALLESNNKIGIIGIKMLGVNEKYRFSAGYFPSIWRMFKFSSLYKKDGSFGDGVFPNDPSIHYEVDWVEGSFMLLRRNLWDNVGGMDQSYFMYVEDVDLCWRIKKRGYKVVLYPWLSYLHYGGYGAGRLNMLVTGFIKFHNKHSSYWYTTLVRTVLMVSLASRILLCTSLGIFGKHEHYCKAAACRAAMMELIS